MDREEQRTDVVTGQEIDQNTEEKQKEQEERRNRQINYFVMRYMWQKIRGRSRKAREGKPIKYDIYDTFGMSRERYTRVIDAGTIRYKSGELDSLSKRTGIRAEIFKGEARFECPILNKDAEKTVIETIPIEIWNTYFELRGEKKKSHAIDMEGETAVKEQEQYPGEHYKRAMADNTERDKRLNAYREKWKKYYDTEQAITGMLNVAIQTDIEYRDFYVLCHYLKNRRAAPARLEQEGFRVIVRTLESISFSLLDECTVQELAALLKRLKEKYQLVQTVHGYKKYKNRK